MKFYSYRETKIGKIGILTDDKSILRLSFGEFLPIQVTGAQECENEISKKAFEQLKEFLNKKRTSFDLPLNPIGTDFQTKVWTELTKIQFGETRSYKEIAEKIGNEKASRAVGMANNKNPIAIFIPCHRVIGKNGKMVGYAGGLRVKEMLLEIES